MVIQWVQERICHATKPKSNRLTIIELIEHIQFLFKQGYQSGVGYNLL